MRFSHSRVETFRQCPYKYKLSYVDRLTTIKDYQANSPLILGSSLHKGLELGKEAALEEYISNFSLITDAHIAEMIKLEYWIDKIELPKGTPEIKVKKENYIGYIDLVDEEGNIYDFKYSNNYNNYYDSRQLHLYKYFGAYPGKMFYWFIPKTFIRQKKTETVEQFRNRLKETLETLEIKKIEIDYDESKIEEFLEDTERIKKETEFKKTPNKFCDWCEFKEYCKKGVSYMLLPKNEKRNLTKEKKISLWLYGSPFSGKTTFSSHFPDVLMLNTDGNIKFVDSPYIAIRDEVTTEGRLTKRKFAWQVFKETIGELEKEQNDFKTITVDLLEDLYEYCRLYMYEELGITHESDDSFRAWDKVRTEFLSTIKKLMNLNYNVILISHEDTSKDITKRSGDKITSIKPNLQDKVANKIAGMVDIVARAYSEDDKRILSFKNDEVIFGGGRLNLDENEIELDYNKFKEIYK